MLVLLAATAAVQWRRLSVALDGRTLLEETDVTLRDGRLLGVLGPSGAGKSTLLLALAGASPMARAHKRVAGEVDASAPPSMSDGATALLTQDDSFFGMLTVEETLTLAARLQPAAGGGDGGGAGGGGPDTRVEPMLSTLGLTGVRATRVGDRNHDGISGGERRRLAIGCELLGSPRLLLADEPTSGLDAHHAERVVSLIRSAAASRGIPAVATLHQPRSSIWAMLDDLLLLAPGGRTVYHGPTDRALSHFARLGHACPAQTNPADFLIDLVSIRHDAPDADAERIGALARAFARARSPPPQSREARLQSARDAPPPPPPPLARRAPAWRRLCWLLQRAWRQNARDAFVNGARLAVSGALALLFGELYGGDSGASCGAGGVAERVALLSYAAVNGAVMSVCVTRPLPRRHRHTHVASIT